MVKIAVVAPMPSANVSNTVNVRPGFLSNPRMPKWRFRRRFRIAMAWRQLYAYYLTFEAPLCSANQQGTRAENFAGGWEVLAFALRGALDGGCFYQPLALLAAARMVGVGEFEQFDGRAVFDYERDADTVGWAVGGNQDFAASKLGGEIRHFKRDVRNLPEEIRPRRVRFETHPLHAKFAFVVADDKKFQVFQVGLARLRFSSGNSDVMVTAHCFSLSAELAQILRCRYRVLKPRPRGRTFEARSQMYFT